MINNNNKNNIRYMTTTSDDKKTTMAPPKMPFFPKDDAPIDFDLISKELNVPITEKGISLDPQMLEKFGVENINVSDQHDTMKMLEQLLRYDEGKKYVNLLISDIKSTFNIDSDENMKIKLDTLNTEYSLKLGVPSIEAFIKEHNTIESMTPEQNKIVRMYFERHPYVKHIRQTGMIVDLVNLVQVYNTTDAATFQEKFDQKFKFSADADQQPASREAELSFHDRQYIEQGNSADEHFATSTLQQEQYDNMLKLIKSDALPAYLDKLFTDAQKQILQPSTVLANEQQKEADDAKERLLKLEGFDGPDEREIYPDVDLTRPVEYQHQAKDPKGFLKYYNLYPQKVKQWVDYTHTPLGFFTNLGVWYNFPEWYAKIYPAMQPEQLVTSGETNFGEQSQIPEDLRSVYRFGVTPEEAAILHPKLREFLSFRNADQGEINAYRRQVCVQKYGNDEADTGSASVQIAIFTERIKYLEAHVSKNRKDNLAKRRIMLLQSQRKSMLNYLKRKNVEEYFRITKDLKIRNTL
ncbi:hypothetical protein SAMD00019534_108070 [Acytostelium subglobosum LB1]|uniref:hypothetical protein n=1 Tax=Acytostelium subglobosum LB1 TaxID=1410327 RepID=UPI000644FD8E|nr:hypothetical protein SAMD00019534_108070 [Acytostelium subglobosum LB1]GAM27631.1 hypothetical protein SAMD00019534_108070 [Acytostelium subglobosum LB1]|eukprot:XP_012749290.1 hypothetical protein SAMD00019534_108070 [Acytostelium subglobosum LB1]